MSPQKPNILFIMADQMIPFLTGAYGHPVVKTPHLNKLVEEGVRFDAAYSPCPVCVPARASLMTGKYVYIHGYESQLFDLEADPGEWHNLAGQPKYKEIEEQLKAHILEQFDPDAIDKAVTESVRKRALVKRAMEISGTRWDVEPRFDPTKGITDQYLSGKSLADIPR